MADKNLNINILAKDKSKQALNSVQGNLNKTKSSVLNLKNALIGLGAGLAIKSIVNVGKEVESLGVRFKFLFGSVEQGAVAFNNLTKFAGKVPFSLEAITRASGSLAVVAKDAQDLNRVLEITGNVAAISGLDFETTAMQIQRAFSGGASAADLFRERGVLAMLGFEAGARVSVEQTIAKFEEVFSGDGRFAGATNDLAETFEGTLSMLGDKVFNFQKTIAEAGFFPELKRQFGNLNETLEENSVAIDQFATKIGIGLAKALVAVVNGMKALKDNADLVFGVLGGIIALKFAGIIYGMTTALLGLTAQMKAFNVATRANIIFGGIAVFIGAMTLLINKFREFKMELVGADVLDLVTDLESATLASEQLALKLENLQSRQGKGKSFNPNIEKEINKTKEQIKELDQMILAFQQSLQFADLRKLQNIPLVVKDQTKAIKTEYSKQIEAMQESFLTEIQLMKKKSDDQLQVINDFLEKEKDLTVKQKEELESLKVKITAKFLSDVNALKDKEREDERKHQEELLKIHKEYIKKNMDLARTGQIKDVDLSKMSQEEKNKIAKAGMRSALDDLSSHNKELFQINKAFKIVDAIVDGVAGVQKALALGPFGIPLAVMIGALTAANVSKIASQQYSGRRTGGQVTGGTPYMVGEQGPELFVPQQSGDIKPNSSLGGTTVNVTIMANDTEGFDNLLVKRRSTIVNVINDALNSQGKEALV
jgi:hypothetical protein